MQSNNVVVTHEAGRGAGEPRAPMPGRRFVGDVGTG